MHIEFQDDPACRSILHEYLLGRDLLVSVYKKELYLPAGSWKDFWTGKVYAGRQSFEAEWPDDRGGCLLVREGALIPFGPLMQYRGERPLDEMELYVFPSAQPTEFELYEDDGVTFDYLQGKYSLTKITQRKDADGTVIITIGDTPAGTNIRTNGDGSFLCENLEAELARTKKNRPPLCEPSPFVRDKKKGCP